MAAAAASDNSVLTPSFLSFHLLAVFASLFFGSTLCSPCITLILLKLSLVLHLLISRYLVFRFFSPSATFLIDTHKSFPVVFVCTLYRLFFFFSDFTVLVRFKFLLIVFRPLLLLLQLQSVVRRGTFISKLFCLFAFAQKEKNVHRQTALCYWHLTPPSFQLAHLSALLICNFILCVVPSKRLFPGY